MILSKEKDVYKQCIYSEKRRTTDLCKPEEEEQEQEKAVQRRPLSGDEGTASRRLQIRNGAMVLGFSSPFIAAL